MLAGPAVRNLLGDAFEAMDIRHFQPEEFVPPGRLAPPLPIIMHILPTVWLLDQARDALGPIRVNSGYRDPVYNASIGGAPNSQHIEFTAADVRPLLTDPLALYEWLESSSFRNRLGLGLYDSFVHVDCRHWPGMPGYGSEPARWQG